MKRLLPILTVLGLALSACAAEPDPPSSRPSIVATEWSGREPIVYSVVVAEVLDDLGSAPPVVYVLDGVCREAGQVAPSELSCAAPFPAEGRGQLAQQLERYTVVEFVDTAEAALGEDGEVRDGGLLFWFGPLKERRSAEVRVGANYAHAVLGEALGVNLALEEQAGSWVVTGAAGLGGCPV
jgi:hypothetical protein